MVGSIKLPPGEKMKGPPDMTKENPNGVC